MPLYEYECGDHGVFELVRRMEESSKNACCPSCGREAARIVSVSNLSRVPRWEAKARERNEKSRHEPRVVSVDRGSSVAAKARSALPALRTR
jgi:putative FmdB family regulatory protein